MGVRVPPGTFVQSRIAQLAERMILNHEAAGSIPVAVVYKAYGVGEAHRTLTPEAPVRIRFCLYVPVA